MKADKRLKIKSTKDKLLRIQVIFGLILILGLALTAWLGLQFFNYNKAIVESNTRLINLQRTTTKTLTAFNDFTQSIDKNRFREKEALSVVFPVGENYTALTKELERYALALNSVDSPMFINRINYANRSQAKVESDYETLPVTIGINSSEENFKKFIEYIYLSGDLNTKVRIMEITGINFAYDSSRDLTGQGNKTVTATINLNAYYKKPSLNQ